MVMDDGEQLRLETPELDEARIERRRSRASQHYRSFLKRLCGAARMSEEFGERAAVSVLCALEQRLQGDGARNLESQLPLQLRNLVARCTPTTALAASDLGRDQFLESIGQDLGMQPDEAEPVIRAVFMAIREQISEGEAQEVMAQLPAEYHDLWQLPL